MGVDELRGGWKPMCEYDVFCVRALRNHGWVHDYSVWKPCAEALQVVVDAMLEPVAVRPSQGDEGEVKLVPDSQAIRSLSHPDGRRYLWE